MKKIDTALIVVIGLVVGIGVVAIVLGAWFLAAEALIIAAGGVLARYLMR